MKTSSCLAVLAALPLLTGCVIRIGESYQDPKVWIEESEAFTVDSADLAGVSCRVLNGSIRATAFEDKAVEVTVRKKAGGADEADARACMDAIDVTQVEKGDTLALGWEWREERQSTWHAVVSVDVRQPAALSFAGRSHNGSVNAEGIRGGVTISTHNGAVRIDDCVGSADLRTHNAPITGAFAGDEVSANSHNGAIDLSISSGGELRGEISTHNSPIKVQLGGRPSAQIVCKTHNGAIALDSSFREVSSSRRMRVVEVGQGEGELAVTTHNGSISVQGGTKVY